MLAFVGLGNPGIKYVNTPHNAGFCCIDELLGRSQIKLQREEYTVFYALGLMNCKEILLAKPLTYMNLSGNAINYLCGKFGLNREEITIIYDDIDLPMGTIRIRKSGSAGAHRGMQSVINSLDSDQISRIRIGIKPDFPIENLTAFVLTPLKKDLFTRFIDGVLLAADAVEEILKTDLNLAMNKFNRKPLASPEERLSNHKEEK